MMRTFSTYLKWSVVLLLLQGCVVTGPVASEAILGSWQTSVGTFPMVVVYSESTVHVGSNGPVSYSLEDDQLTYADGGQQIRVVSFPSAAEMIQTDPVTGTEHRFTRLP